MHEVTINKERLQAAHQGLIAMMNQLDEVGFTPDEVLCALLFTAGASLRRRGVTLDAGAAVGQQLPPLVLGYEMAQPQPQVTEQQRILRAKGYVC